MAEYDLIIKALAERYMDKIASFVRGVPVAVEQIEDKDKEAVAVQRTSDALVKVREDGYEYLMLVEFQARPDRKMARRLLEYTAMHHCRHEKPVYPVVINLTGGSRQDGRYMFECLDLTVVDFNYRQINLQDIAGRDLLYRGPVGLLPLAPLMRQEEPPEAVLEKCASRFESEVQGVEERSTLYLALGVLAALRLQKGLVQKILEVSKMENSPFFDGIREEWEARGRDEGIVEAIMEALEENTGQRPVGLKERLSEIRNSDILKKILRRAVKAKTFEEFESVFIDLKSN
ncbi:Rpn family recombination-promoting nuclease/putative transposase [Pelotomaculum isophthalicicum JI]|uniref:Rpn family recombination-promoting nuclease/putative transposase n=1 Tax=Pelotomaculum isophthalicicum JI TaxID=947010 RepID=A0A9X4JW46_9FIRM|nr:Rpn family recombination-promoting nuclease/putative transposase [Pelotomaculum isophthalicicum]MDF9409491.1 Rpn family recombination-promoting nuclease/putative transposase [Pelotomaculum isophthalicicum JI]